MSAEAPAAVALGDYTARRTTTGVAIEGQDTDKVAGRGVASIWEVTGPDALRVLVRYTRWESGAHDVSLHDRCDAPPRLDRLASGLRLGVTDRGCELWQARLKPGGWSNTFKATADELREGAGVDVEQVLLAAGAERVGTREELWGDGGRRRASLAVTFPPGGEAVPVAAYVLTRIAPLHRGLEAAG